jgi:hypothetical protein
VTLPPTASPRPLRRRTLGRSPSDPRAPQGKPRRPLPHRARAQPGRRATGYLPLDLKHECTTARKVLWRRRWPRLRKVESTGRPSGDGTR